MNRSITPEIGSLVRYIAFGGTSRLVRVEYVTDDIKNGRPGFDGIVVGGPDDGMSVWGYQDQIISCVAQR